MAGSDPGFDPVAFRQAIRFAMTMGTPNNPSDQATFRWTVQKSYAVADVGGVPYNWNETPSTVVTHADVKIPVAVRSSAVSDEQTTVGVFKPAKVVLTILDDDFAQIDGASTVLLGGDEYIIDFVAPPEGLFEVDVYRVYCTARSET
jgi:hypothetical protein